MNYRYADIKLNLFYFCLFLPESEGRDEPARVGSHEEAVCPAEGERFSGPCQSHAGQGPWNRGTTQEVSGAGRYSQQRRLPWSRGTQGDL